MPKWIQWADAISAEPRYFKAGLLDNLVLLSEWENLRSKSTPSPLSVLRLKLRVLNAVFEACRLGYNRGFGLNMPLELLNRQQAGLWFILPEMLSKS